MHENRETSEMLAVRERCRTAGEGPGCNSPGLLGGERATAPPMPIIGSDPGP
jgi:hypothetical protein